jgi:hypothetical protein
LEISTATKCGELLKPLDNDYAAALKGKRDKNTPMNLTKTLTRIATYKPMEAEDTMTKNHAKRRTRH